MATMDDEFIKAQGYGEPGDYALLSVSDTGVGMEEKTMEHIFEPFFTTKEAGKGTGLGLSTVYGAVKQHNGYISVDSEPHRGTRFQVWLPLVHSREEEAVLELQDARKGTETILVAEDDPAVRTLLVAILRGYGYTPIEAADGLEALGLFTENRGRINLIICDVVMPKMNGKEVCEEIKRTRPNMKVLFTSGYTREVIIDKGAEDATVDFIIKPIKPREFLIKVREVLDRELA
jgi:CheY-like chemotaxis protein